jgi:ring-1,2-phenylacetyl-CoA epoxidase subunit PaaE
MPTMAVPQFHRLRIREVRPETDDSVSVAFEVPQPLREAYRFVQGQFLTLREQIGGEELRRSYSVCVGVPDYDRTGELRVAIKRVAGGRFSNWATNSCCRSRDRRDDPDGRLFTPLAPAKPHYVGFAGGSGITRCSR